MNSVFHLKEKFYKKKGCKRLDTNDGVLINEKENEKEKKSSTAKTVGQRYIFAKRVPWGI